MAHYAFASRLIGGSGGGIGARVAATAERLSVNHRVTLIVSSAREEEIRQRFAANASVELVFVPEPDCDEPDSFQSREHLWSMRLYRAVKALCAEDAPDLVQFSDYEGEAAVTVQARRTADPALAKTTVAVWLATSWEIADVLDGAIPDSRLRRAAYALERYSLAFADCLVHLGPEVRRTYERFYGAEALAPMVEYRATASMFDGPSAAPAAAPGDPLKILYAGRLERRKGVLDLVRALAHAPFDGWTLTLVGEDTGSGSIGSSMRGILEAAAGGDPRIEFTGAVPHDEMAARFDAADVVISPSIWEAVPNVAVEALARNRAVLATPVGGHFLAAREAESGMLADGTGRDALERLVRRAVDDRAGLRELMAAGRPRAVFEQLTDGAALDDQFARAAAAGRAPVAPIETTLVSVVIPYYRMHDYIEETLSSVEAQTWPHVETVIVRDGSFFPEDAVLDEIADAGRARVLAKRNGGVGSARNFGARHSNGELIVTLDADNRLHPEFIARAVAALAAEPHAAYVTSNLRLIDADGAVLHNAGVAPMLGNFTAYSEEMNIAGDAMAMVRASVFDDGFEYDEEMAGHEDWELYTALRHAGRHGHAIPESLLEYRVRTGSMLRSLAFGTEAALVAERDARVRAGELQWTP